jgi:hypothetical protein
MKPEKIPVAEFHARLRAQGVSDRIHAAVICPVCGTVQSIASLIRAGATPDEAENKIGFSCEGRLTGAGPWPSAKDESEKAVERRSVRGCDWTLGGLFTIHELEVITEDGKSHPSFTVATPAVAQALETKMTALNTPEDA